MNESSAARSMLSVPQALATTQPTDAGSMKAKIEPNNLAGCSLKINYF